MAIGILQAIDAGAVEDPDRTFRDIIDTADRMGSILRSLSEDAYRRNGFWLRMHRQEFVHEARLLSGLLRDLSPIKGEAGK
jgi:hypothetical protein